MFDIPPPEHGVRGIDAYRETWPPFFEWQASGALFEIEPLDVTAGTDVAFDLLLCGKPEQLERNPEQRLRLTIGLRRADGRWTVAHEHHSFADETAPPELLPPRWERCTSSDPTALRPKTSTGCWSTSRNGQVAVHLNREIGNTEIDPLTAPRSIQAIVALHDQLNQAQSRYPGTDLALGTRSNPTLALHELPLYVIRSPGPQAHQLRDAEFPVMYGRNCTESALASRAERRRCAPYLSPGSVTHREQKRLVIRRYDAQRPGAGDDFGPVDRPHWWRAAATGPGR
jgi:SnoaL-like domain